MLVISVEFLFGTYRADPDGSALTGQPTNGEWPPAPARLFAALVSADGTADRCRVTTGEELRELEILGAPLIYSSTGSDVHHQPLQNRYVVRADTAPAKGKTVQEYVARVSSLVRPGARVSMRDSRVVFVWPGDVSAPSLRSLQLRAGRIGYLGCADSPVRVTVSTEIPENLGDPFEPHRDGAVLVAVPKPGTVDQLDSHYRQWLKHGPSVRRSQSVGLRNLVTYRGPDERYDSGVEQPAVLWLAMDRSVNGRRVLAVTQALRGALLSAFQQRYGDPPAVLHGHGHGGVGYDTARYLSLPDAGYRHSRGRIHGLALWFPPKVDASIVERCRESLRGATQLRWAGGQVTIRAWDGEDRPWAANPKRWLRASHRLATVIPALHERRRRSLCLDDVASWCEHAGLPAPVAMREGRRPFIDGGVDLAPSEVNRVGRPARRYSHLELVFDEVVAGPAAVGAGRQFGLGLLAPIGGTSNG